MTRIHSIFPVPFPGVSASVPLQEVPYNKYSIFKAVTTFVLMALS